MHILVPINEFEQSLTELTASESREAKISHVRDGIDSFRAEVNWKRQCKPPSWLLCLIPLLWPILWYRSMLSRAAQHALSIAIHRYRRKWATELTDAGLFYDGIPDPSEPDRQSTLNIGQFGSC